MLVRLLDTLAARRAARSRPADNPPEPVSPTPTPAPRPKFAAWVAMAKELGVDIGG